MTSLRTLASANTLHKQWLARTGARLTEIDMDLLTAVVRPAGYLPDFLLPTPPHRTTGFESALLDIAAADPGLVAAELAHLAGHRVAQQGPGREHRLEILGELVESPREGLARIVAELDRYWRVAVAPDWPRMRALLEADLTYRLQELASGGVRQLFRTLHPSVGFEGDTLSVVKYYDGDAELRRRGILLIPCVFAWPDVIVRTADPQPALTYAPRGIGRLWESRPAAQGHPLAEVVGRTRASILAQLDLPMSTTQLACQLDLAAPTLSVHLKALDHTGIVSARRDGRTVLYQRTRLGDLLLNGGGAGGAPGRSR